MLGHAKNNSVYFRYAPPGGYYFLIDPTYHEIWKGMAPEKKKNLGIKRETADRILKEMVESARKINSSPKTELKKRGILALLGNPEKIKFQTVA